MRFKKMMAALLACLALTAVAASAAQANWLVAGSALSGSETVSLSKTGTENLKLVSKVNGSNVEITATGIECATAGGCTIDNGSTNHSAGKLKFTGITFMKPATCGLVGGATTLTTEALEDEVVMSGTNTFDKFKPAGSGVNFAQINIGEGPAGECPLSGNSPFVTGVAYGQTAATGVETVTQVINFNSTSAALSTLKLGPEAATITGEVANKLSGTNVGKVFGANE